jgi:hypothetical protein
MIASRKGSGAPRYLVKPYSIALAVSIVGAVILFTAGRICSQAEAGKPYFCGYSLTSKTSILWH